LTSRVTYPRSTSVLRMRKTVDFGMPVRCVTSRRPSSSERESSSRIWNVLRTTGTEYLPGASVFTSGCFFVAAAFVFVIGTLASISFSSPGFNGKTIQSSSRREQRGRGCAVAVDGMDAERRLFGRIVGGGTVDRIGPKRHDVGEVSRGKNAAVCERITGGRFAGNLVNRFGERQPAFLPRVSAEQKRKGAVQARMRPPFYVETVADDRRERMLQGHAQVLGALIETEHRGVAFFFVEQFEHNIGRLLAALFGDLHQGLADGAEIRFRADRRNINVGPVPWNGARELVSNSLPLRRIAKPLQQLTEAAIQGALRQQLGEDAGTGDVGIAIEFHVDAFGVRTLHGVDGFSVQMPVRCSDGLQVRDLKTAAAVASEVELLFDRVYESGEVGADVAGINLSLARGHVAEALELVGWRAGAGSVHQARRKSRGARVQGLGEQAFHRGYFGFTQRALLAARDRDAQRAVPHKRDDIGRAAIGDGAKIGFGGRPSPLFVSAKNAVRERAQVAWLACGRIRRKAAIADHFRGNALAQFFGAAVKHLKVGVSVRIDETRRQRETSTVDYSGGCRLEDGANLEDAFSTGEYVCVDGRGPSAVQDGPVTEEGIRQLFASQSF